MTDQQPQSLDSEIPEAIVTDRRHHGIPWIWVVPLVALAIALAMVWHNYVDQGPVITIHFSQAAGVEAGKTRIKYRDVVIGMVERVHFSKDFSEVVVTAQMDKGLKGLLSENTRFWVVRPRISLTRASGIDTLFSGVYIGMDPGKKGRETHEFQGLNEPPNVLADDKGSLFHLQASALGSISIGSPVYYRQVRVGRVTGFNLEPEEDLVSVDVFIDAPHDRLVRTNSRFWNASGVSLDLSGGGLRLNLESLTALIGGGVAFHTPEELGVESRPAPTGSRFLLYPDRRASEQGDLSLTVSYVLYFNETVRGLEVGAPVEFRGIRVGTVSDIELERDPETDEIRIPVLISMEPERIPLSDEGVGRLRDISLMQELMERLVARGLRARLKTGNLLTGKLIVDFEFVPDAGPASVDYSGKYPALPTAPNELANILTSLSGSLSKLDRLPLDEIGAQLLAASQGMNRLINDPKLQSLPTKLERGINEANSLLATLEQKGGPMMDDLARTIASADKTLQAVRATFSSQGAVGGELARALREMAAAARSVSTLSDYLERHPEALLKGKR